MILLQDIGLDNGAEVVEEAVSTAVKGFRWYDAAGVTEMLLRFGFFLLVLFFIVYLLGSVKVKIGFALGLFAIFGVLRYRTETIPVREMSYMFGVISLSVINALADALSFAELLLPNAAIALLIWMFETFVLRRNLASKLILYDRIELISPERREELIEDLHKRTGLNITKVNVGSIDFLKDTAILKIEYENDCENTSHVNNTLKIHRDEWENVRENN